MTRLEEIKKKIADKAATFKVGDVIRFSKWNHDEEVQMTGTIVSIKGYGATVEHKHGTCFISLTEANHV